MMKPDPVDTTGLVFSLGVEGLGCCPKNLSKNSSYLGSPKPLP